MVMTDMAENPFSFILDNRLAAVTSAFSGAGIYAADGAEPRVYDVSARSGECGCGEGCGCYPSCTTVRPYRVLRSDPTSAGRYTAVTGTDRRIYTLDNCFSETGYTVVQNGGGSVTDACVYRADGETRYAAVSGNAACGYDRNGNFEELLWSVPEGAYLNSFWALTPEYCAACYSRGGMDFFAVRENGVQTSVPVPEELNLRSVFAGDDGVYGLFGINYLYNKIARIYANGAVSFEKLSST